MDRKMTIITQQERIIYEFLFLLFHFWRTALSVDLASGLANHVLNLTF